MTESNHPVPGPAAEPIETERQARELPAVQAVYAAFDADPGPGKMIPHNLWMLLDAVAAAGVHIGAYDDRILRWLAGWEPAICAVVAGLITRAAAATPGAAKLAAIRAVLGAFDWEFDDRQLALEAIERIIGEDASPEEAVKTAVAELHAPHRDTLREVFADAVHQDHRDAASLFRTLASAFGINPEADSWDDQ